MQVLVGHARSARSSTSHAAPPEPGGRRSALLMVRERMLLLSSQRGQGLIPVRESLAILYSARWWTKASSGRQRGRRDRCRPELALVHHRAEYKMAKLS